MWSASKAVDGILYDPYNKDYAYTLGDYTTEQWWMVDLEDTYAISEVYIYGRIKQCMYA